MAAEVAGEQVPQHIEHVPSVDELSTLGRQVSSTPAMDAAAFSRSAVVFSAPKNTMAVSTLVPPIIF